jgi:hypothetical protein
MKATYSVEIFAPQAVVWNTTLDVENWPAWTPTVEYIKRQSAGDMVPGNRVIIKQPGLPETEWRVSEVQPKSYLVGGQRFVAYRLLRPIVLNKRQTA